ncbi:hypothetical protein AGLY_005205 [Aphis glycines]|uniref:Uncharacterized protein n=1 Tax=Aphis glycines TaxID=307491 RepID=A0A6G0TYH5_APHGL|nr:hypothetical protein AGLY_005205 [Aphis glycines]
MINVFDQLFVVLSTTFSSSVLIFFKSKFLHAKLQYKSSINSVISSELKQIQKFRLNTLSKLIGCCCIRATELDTSIFSKLDDITVHCLFCLFGLTIVLGIFNVDDKDFIDEFLLGIFNSFISSIISQLLTSLNESPPLSSSSSSSSSSSITISDSLSRSLYSNESRFSNESTSSIIFIFSSDFSMFFSVKCLHELQQK